MGIITKQLHNKIVYSRRMMRLTELLIPLLSDSYNVLDVGCGDGKIDSNILQQRKDIHIQGIDVLVRPETFIPVEEYDGETIPYKDNSFDTVITVDVLHHIDNPILVLKELTRVSSKYVIIKDHIRGGIWTYLKLRAMDYVGNAHYHVRLPYNYQSAEQWEKMFISCGLRIKEIKKQLNLYTGMLHFLFDRNLHFIAVLEKTH